MPLSFIPGLVHGPDMVLGILAKIVAVRPYMRAEARPLYGVRG